MSPISKPWFEGTEPVAPVSDMVERLRPWLRHTLSCASQRDLNNDTVCRCGLDAALTAMREDSK
jgi:hypothetical protein